MPSGLKKAPIVSSSVPPRVLAFAGSTRKDSFHKLLARAGAKAIEAAAGAATLIDLSDFPAPIYNGDDEKAHGIPAKMRELKWLMDEHDALMIATPEYNGHVPPLLVNIFCWCSRPESGEASCRVMAGKPAAIMAASPGSLGGVRVVSRLRDFLCDVGCVPVQGFATVPNVNQAFDEMGELLSEKTRSTLATLANRVVTAGRHYRLTAHKI